MRSIFKKSASIAAACMLALSGVAAVHAEDTETTENYPKVVYEQEWEGTGPYYKSVTINVTIPKGVTDPVLPIYAFKELDRGVAHQPGDYFTYKINIADHSGKNYHYSENSLNMSPAAQDLTNPNHTYYRTDNIALRELGIANRRNQLTDAFIGQKLQANNYGADLTPEEATKQFLDDYYVDYYNSHLAGEGQSVKTIMEVPSSYADTLFLGKADSNDSFNHSDAKETNDELNKLAYRHAYDTIFTINDIPMASYVSGKDAYSTMENKIESAVTKEDTITLKLKSDGARMTNVFMNTSYSFPYNFTLVQDGVTPDKKVSEPDLEKKIVGGDSINVDASGDFATVDASGKINFQLTSHVGQDLAEVIVPNEAVAPGTAPDKEVDPFSYGTYTFTFVDYLDKELAFDAASLKLSINGTEVTPVSVVTSEVAEGDYAGRTEIRIDVDLIQAFKDKLFTYSEIGTAPIIVTYTASLKDRDHVEPGKMYNAARVEYQSKKSEIDTVDADTYGLKIFKYDQTTTKGLEGAEFKLVYIDEEGNKVEVATNLTSDANGNVVVKGLKAGEYQLTETKAPAGYNKSDSALKILVNAENDDEEYYVTTNFANVPEVHTGGAGTTMFTIGGGLLILAGAAYLIVSKKRAAE